MRGVWLRWGLAAAWVIVVLAFGSTTIFPDNGQVPRLLLRKAAHLGLYAMLGLLCYVALAPRDHRRRAGAGRGNARRLSGEKAGGKKDLENAVRLDPSLTDELRLKILSLEREGK